MRSTSARTSTPRSSSCWRVPTAHPRAPEVWPRSSCRACAPTARANGFRIRRLKPKLGTRGVPTAEVSLEGAVAWLASQPSERPRSGDESEPRDRASERGLAEDDGDGQRESVWRRVDGARNSPPIVPRGRDLRRAPRAMGPADRPVPDGARDARRPVGDARRRHGPHVRVRGRHADRRRRRRRPPVAAHPGAAGQGPRNTRRPRRSHASPRDPRGQRLHGGLADGAPAPRRPVPHDLGRHREHLLPRRPARDSTRRRARSTVRARRAGVGGFVVCSRPRRRGRYGGAHARRRARRRRLPRRRGNRSPVAARAPTHVPTRRPDGGCALDRRSHVGPRPSTATPARRSSRAGSRTSGSPRCPPAASSTPTARCSTTSTRSRATARSTRPTW